MHAKTHRPVQSRFDGFKVLDGEKLLQWLIETAEEAMGLSYELNKMRTPDEDPAE
jgi:hypothetical protein